MRRLSIVTRLLSALALSGAGGPLAAGEVQGPSATDEAVVRAVLERLKGSHILKREIDDDMAAKAVAQFVGGLDSDKTVFRRADIDEFDRDAKDLADKLKKGDASLAFKVFRRYQERVAKAAKVWTDLLGADARYGFSADEVKVVNADALDYPKTDEEAAERWRLTIKHSLLAAKASADGKDFDAARECKTLLRRFDKFARSIDRFKSEAVLSRFLQSVGHRYDSLTYWISPASLKEFEVQNSGVFAGIGVQTQEDDLGIRVTAVLPGGAAAKDGRLKPDDLILSVGQGDEGEMTDLADLTLGEMVALVRGKPGTSVRLEISRRNSKVTKVIALKREKMLAAGAEVKAKVYRQGKKQDSTPFKVGHVELRSFYLDDDGDRSATKDVRKKLEEFAAAGVDVVVLDLRDNVGGYLDECVKLPGLFVGALPVLRVKDNGGGVSTQSADAAAAWDKPLVVLANRRTASGAEIVCGAIQDYGRGLIVGQESTYGDGKVSRIVALSDRLAKGDAPADLGKLKYTDRQFYLPNGESPQQRGVLADLALPALAGERGPEAEPAVDRVPAAEGSNFGMVHADLLAVLREQSRDRRAASADFAKVQKGIEWERTRRRQTLVSLNEAKYREQQKRDEMPAQPEAKAGEPDYYLKEVFAVAADYADLLRGRTAKAAARGLPAAGRCRREARPAPKSDPAALRRGLDIRILDADRALERDREAVARFERDVREWGAEVETADEALKDGKAGNRKAATAAARAYANGRKQEAAKSLDAAGASLKENRDRLIQLKLELVRVRD